MVFVCEIRSVFHCLPLYRVLVSAWPDDQVSGCRMQGCTATACCAVQGFLAACITVKQTHFTLPRRHKPQLSGLDVRFFCHLDPRSRRDGDRCVTADSHWQVTTPDQINMMFHCPLRLWLRS